MHVSKEKTLLSRLLVITRKRVSRSWPVLPAGLAPSGTNLEKETEWKKKSNATENEEGGGGKRRRSRRKGRMKEKGKKERKKKKEKSKEIHRGVTDSFINKNDIGPLQLVLWTHILSPGTIELTVAR